MLLGAHFSRSGADPLCFGARSFSRCLADLVGSLRQCALGLGVGWVLASYRVGFWRFLVVVCRSFCGREVWIVCGFCGLSAIGLF